MMHIIETLQFYTKTGDSSIEVANTITKLSLKRKKRHAP